MRRKRVWLAVRVWLLVGISMAFVFWLAVSGLGDKDPLSWALIGSTVVGAIYSMVLAFREHRDLQAALSEAEEDPKELLQRRIHRVNEAVALAASEMQALQRDLEAQQAASSALLAQAEEQQRLLEINQEQAERIRHILVGETKATIRDEGRKQWMFFALGIVVSIPIGVAINLFVP
ncbi:hypothetical protein ACFSKW_12140 [Nonomuraea mangrovi]|uniref:Uncharacterized protein n=1 Tax=Nonomuraea mangrovi TaxID=2316207 RepID=A0ABW4STE4_9ACTN